MPLDLKFSEVGSFDAESPLDRQIQQLEANTSQAFDTVALAALGRLSPTATKTASYATKLGELVVTSGSLTVTLPVSTSRNAGEEIAILRQSGTITVLAASGLVQGAASDSLATTGLFRYTSTGTGWWR